MSGAGFIIVLGFGSATRRLTSEPMADGASSFHLSARRSSLETQ